ncbi:MAG: photosynthetic reaction center cytochrome c subunit family protein [Bacteroidota bacterium]
MIARKQFITIAVLFVLVISGIAAIRMPARTPRNLKYYPQISVIKSSTALCRPITGPWALAAIFVIVPPLLRLLPFSALNLLTVLTIASDEKPMKEEARRMMRLTIQLNKDYFYFDTLQRPEYLKVVTCYTCHRGDAFPADLK